MVTPHQPQIPPPKIKSRRVISFLFVIIVLLIIGGSIDASIVVQDRIMATSDRYFESDTSEITNGIVREIENYNTLLYAGRGLITSSEVVTQTEWQDFYKSQAFSDRYKGVSTVYFIKPVASKDVDTLERQMRQEPFFGKNFTIQRSSQKDIYGIVTLIFSSNDISSSFGFDGFSDYRKAVYDAATASGKPAASQPFKFNTGHYGFFIALPVFKADQSVQGYVAASFRANDFGKAIAQYNNKNIQVDIADITDPQQPISLYTSSNQKDFRQLYRKTTLEVAGRKWQLTYSAAQPYNDSRLNKLAPKFVILVGGLLILLVCSAYIIVMRRRIV